MKFSNGGWIGGNTVITKVKFPANECIIDRERVCVRRDEAHRGAPRDNADWITCPLHDEV